MTATAAHDTDIAGAIDTSETEAPAANIIATEATEEETPLNLINHTATTGNTTTPSPP